MVLPSISFLDALSRGEVSWPTAPSEASESDSDLGEASLYSSSSGTISAMRRIPAEGGPSRQAVQGRGLQQESLVKRKGPGEAEVAGERSSSGRGRGKRSGGVRGGKGVAVGVGEAGEDMGEAARTPFEVVEKRYACAVGLEKWERGAMIVWAGGEREVRLKSLFWRFSSFPLGKGGYHVFFYGRMDTDTQEAFIDLLLPIPQEKNPLDTQGLCRFEGKLETDIGCGTQSLARTRLRLLKSLAGLPPDASRPMEGGTPYYDEGADSESTFGGSQGEELPGRVKF